MNEPRIGERVGMQRRFKPYPAYKDSGVEWLGEIPAHWTATALKRIGDLQAGAGFPDDEQGALDEELPFFKVGDLGMPGNERQMLTHQHSVSRATARRLRAFVFPPSTIVFAKVGAALLLNRRRLLARPSCIDNNMMGFMPDKCDPTWAMYWLAGLDMGELANPGAVPSVNEDQMRDTATAAPPVPEQRAIAAFLDRETARIDVLVEKKERLIELLQEKRTALITRAVTKGLDPTVPMKDSGVEGLGEIPAHWTAKRLKFVAAKPIRNGIGEAGAYDDPDWPRYVRITDIAGPRELRHDTFKSLPPDLAREAPFEVGDLLLAAVGATFGKSYLHLRDCGPVCFAGYMVRFSPGAVVEPSFAAYWTESAVYWALVQFRVVQATIQNFSAAKYKELSIPLPSGSEQRAIAAFLDRETARIDALIAKVREAIERLKELRTALISAAVTGKIDVRESGVAA